jgi:hypothetical protein
VLTSGSVAALVVCGSCSTFSTSGADADAGRGDDADAALGEAAADGTAGDGPAVPPCFDAGQGDAAFIVSEDFTTSGCDGWSQTGVGLSLAEVVDTSCGVRACEICATADAGGAVYKYYSQGMTMDGGSYIVSGWLTDRDGGSGAVYVLNAGFFTSDFGPVGTAQATGGFTGDWTFAVSPPSLIAPGADQVQLALTPLGVQPGGCLRVTHLRVAATSP